MIYGLDNNGNIVTTFNFNVIFSGNVQMNTLLENSNVKYILFTIENYPYTIANHECWLIKKKSKKGSKK